MNILLIANYQPDRQESMQRVAQLLETELIQVGHSVRVIRPKPWIGRLKPGPTGLGKWLGYIDKFLIFPRQLRSALKWADVVHICDHSNAFYTKYLQQIPHVVSCNDLLAIRSALGEIPQNPTRWSGKQLQRMILAGLNQAQRVTCISEKTRQEVLRLTHLSPEAVSCVYLGLNYPYSPLPEARSRLEPLGIAPEISYVLHVGGEHWYKNRFGVLRIFHALRSRLQPESPVADCDVDLDHNDSDRHSSPDLNPDLYLVMAGAPLPPESQQWLEAQGLSHRVISCVGVSNEELRALYSAATALIFPSLEEGFGWPILEAHACGCPVFTSDRPPMTEVGGSAAFYFNPEEIETAAATIAQHLPTLKDTVEANLRNADRFSNARMIQGYLQDYDRARKDRAV